jgi:hypothetical protein
MSLLFPPVYSPTRLLQLPSFLHGKWPSPLFGGAFHTTAAVTSLPLSKHTGGGGATPAFSVLLVYLQLTWGSALPHSGGAFHRTAAGTSFPLSKVAVRVLLLLPSLASLFIYSSPEGLAIPHSPELRASHPLCYLSFFSAASLLFSLFFSLFFPLGGGQSVQWAMLIWPRVVCGSSVCRWAHLVVCISQVG